EELDIHIVPLYIHFQEEQYISGVTMDIPHFYRKIKESDALPSSSAPNPSDYYKAYKAVDPAKPILMLSLSKGLSSTYRNALAGRDMLLDEEPNRKIEVINTKTASCGLALLLHEAGNKIKENYSFHQLTEHIQHSVDR